MKEQMYSDSDEIRNRKCDERPDAMHAEMRGEIRNLYSDIPVLVSRSVELTREERLELLPKLLIPWYRKDKRDLPWRHDITPYRVWISEIMLQQTRVEAVKPYYARFLAELPSITDLAAVDDDKLMKLWEGLGYYSRARNLKKAAIICAEEYQGEMPDSYEKLLALPGIGSYTAGAIGSIAFGLPAPAVDGNVLRVITRILGDSTDITQPKFKTQIEKELAAVLSAGTTAGSGDCSVDPEGTASTSRTCHPGDFNSSLMELGAMVCVPNGTPHCSSCPAQSICVAHREGRCEELPVKAAKKARKIVNLDVFVIRCGDEILIRKRPEGGMLAGLYEFPNTTEGDGSLASIIIEVINYRVNGDDVLPSLTMEPSDCDEIRANSLTSSPTGTKNDQKMIPVSTLQARHIFTHVEWHMNGSLIEVDRPAFMRLAERIEGAIPVSEQKIRSEAAIPGAFQYFLKLL